MTCDLREIPFPSSSSGSHDDTDETNLHTTSATANNETKKDRTSDRDDNDDRGPEKWRRIDEGICFDSRRTSHLQALRF